MLSKILDILKSTTTIKLDKDGNQASEQLQVATAVLLFSVAGSDSDFDPVEVRKTFSLIAENFGLEKEETMEILTQAEEKFKKDSNIDSEVKLVNDSYDDKQKQLIFSLAWNIVCVDGKIENHEQKFASNLSNCLLYTSPSPRDATLSRMPSSA